MPSSLHFFRNSAAPAFAKRVRQRSVAVEQEAVDPEAVVQHAQLPAKHFVHGLPRDVVKSAVSADPFGHCRASVGQFDECSAVAESAVNRPVSADEWRDGQHEPESFVVQFADEGCKIAVHFEVRRETADRRLPPAGNDQRSGRIACGENVLCILPDVVGRSRERNFRAHVVHRGREELRRRSRRVFCRRKILMAADQVGFPQGFTPGDGFDLFDRRFDPEFGSGIFDLKGRFAPDVASPARNQQRSDVAFHPGGKVRLRKRLAERHRLFAPDEYTPPLFSLQYVDFRTVLRGQRFAKQRGRQYQSCYFFVHIRFVNIPLFSAGN